jgi:hypothetical protein
MSMTGLDGLSATFLHLISSRQLKAFIPSMPIIHSISKSLTMERIFLPLRSYSSI